MWGATRPFDLIWIQRYISIHAPRVGCDDFLQLASTKRKQFQSTHPVWGATSRPTSNPPAPRGFQSTHPVWGATVQPLILRCSRLLISIHAPRVGCDKCDFIKYVNMTISIHAPRVGCDKRGHPPLSPARFISIHAPRVGCDMAWSTPSTRISISIHAPRVGCDEET